MLAGQSMTAISGSGSVKACRSQITDDVLMQYEGIAWLTLETSLLTYCGLVMTAYIHPRNSLAHCDPYFMRPSQGVMKTGVRVWLCGGIRIVTPKRRVVRSMLVKVAVPRDQGGRTKTKGYIHFFRGGK